MSRKINYALSLKFVWARVWGNVQSTSKVQLKILDCQTLQKEKAALNTLFPWFVFQLSKL